jgi:hypothetical protein
VDRPDAVSGEIVELSRAAADRAASAVSYRRRRRRWRIGLGVLLVGVVAAAIWLGLWLTGPSELEKLRDQGVIGEIAADYLEAAEVWADPDASPTERGAAEQRMDEAEAEVRFIGDWLEARNYLRAHPPEGATLEGLERYLEHAGPRLADAEGRPDLAGLYKVSLLVMWARSVREARDAGRELSLDDLRVATELAIQQARAEAKRRASP